MREQWAETGMGLVVVALAAIFLTYSLTTGGFGGKGKGYKVTAKFGEAGALASGASVNVAGVKVGTVSKITLDPKTFLAVTTINLNDEVKLPKDSTAKITSDGLLGGAHVSIAPGGAAENLKDGDEIENTQGAVDLFGLIGSVMRPQTPAPAATEAAPAPATDAAALPDL